MHIKLIKMRIFYLFIYFLSLFYSNSMEGQSFPFMELTEEKEGVVLDIRYATPNNFTKSVLYPCGRCFLHPTVAKALQYAVKDFRKLGYNIILFDCYRPLSIQRKLWEKVPDSRYVTPPAKGSMHNRGAAVDISLQDIKSKKELDMGTPYDYFGKEAYMDYEDITPVAAKNRKLLHTTLVKYGFKPIRTEWWHFSFSGSGATISEWNWTCP
jgi:D-alanyl-D-alanine dipeptidase